MKCNKKGDDKMKTITIANQKGGVGKTTTAMTFAIGLAKKKFRVLAIDCDSQENFSFTCGIKNPEKSVFNVLLQEPIEECIIHTKQGIDLIPSDEKLLLADSTFTQENDIFRLKVQLQKLSEKYDFVIIDTPPTLNTITKNCFIASDSIIIPMHTEIYSMQGLSKLLDIINEAQRQQREKNLNEVKIEGILLTQFNGRTILNRALSKQIETISKTTGLKIFKTTIRNGIAIREAQNNQTNIFDYDSRSKVARDYQDFINEYLKSK